MKDWTFNDTEFDAGYYSADLHIKKTGVEIILWAVILKKKTGDKKPVRLSFSLSLAVVV